MKKILYLCTSFILFFSLLSSAQAQTYCSIGNNCTLYNITNVSFGSINNTSICGTNGYSNYTSIVTDLMQGSYVPINVTVNVKQSTRFVYCYIDYNNSGSFDSKEYTLLSSSNGNSYSGYVKVPFNARIGVARMRVMYGDNATSSCYPGYYSETEDYSVNITPNTTSAKGHVIYVKDSAPGSDNTGRSWANAMTNVRQAVAIATQCDTIKVASGTYYSGADQTNGITLSDSVTVLGGYPNTGSPTDGDRNASTNQTILDGFKSSTTPYTNADYHVFFAGQTKDCIVDGFIIQNKGYSYGTGGQTMGRGVRIENSSNIIFKNCVFTKNYDYDKGSAISVFHSDVKFINCILTKNQAYYNSILIEKGSSVNFINFLAAANSGGYLMESDSSTVNFKNCTVANNVFEKGVLSASNQSQLNFINSILYYNAVYSSSWQTLNYDSVEIKSSASIVNLGYSLLQTLRTGTGLITGTSARFKDTSSLVGPDGFYFTADDGFTLTNPCSPALNAGSNAEASGITTDMIGQPRTYGTSVDMGAYELQQSLSVVPKVIYVNPAATGANNGSSWTDAYTDLHKALQACSDTIKLAAGTYQPWKSSIDPSFYWLENNRVILGAYPPTGNPTNADRNYDLYMTNIDGTTNSGQKALTVMRGISLDSTSIIDGLTFANTNSNNFPQGGALLYSRCLNPVISNCSFTKNSVRAFEGRDNEQLRFTGCKVFDNSTIDNGYGGQLFLLTNCGKTIFKKCIFQNNSLSRFNIVSEYGTVLTLNNTNAAMESCIFKSNKANILLNNGSAPYISNALFLNNYAADVTTDVFNRNSDPIFSNCIFRDSITTAKMINYGGIMNNYISKPIFTDCQFYNGQTYRFGGLAYNDSSCAKFTNCVFTNCINTFYNTNSSNIELTNCINYGSKASAFASPFMYNYRSSPVITNCTITGSEYHPNPLITNEAGSNPKIYNSVFWKNFINYRPNSSPDRIEIQNNSGSQPVIQNSMFEVYNAGGNNKTAVDPRFKNYLSPIGKDSIWFTADDGLRLCDCSDAINSGNNSFIQNATDITGLPRIINNTVDRGAYELQTAPAASIKTAFVNASAIGNNTGAGWKDAYTSLQTAISNPCVDTIKLAAGTYKPAFNERDSVFNIDHTTVVLGSYDTLSDKRDVEAYPSIISGDIGIARDTADNSYGLIRAFYFDSLVLDGIVLQDVNNQNKTNSYQNYSALNAQGLQFLSIKNCRFNSNFNLTYSNADGGGAMAVYIKKLEVEKTVFSGNKAIWGGGLYYNGIGSGGARIENSIFSQNEASLGGGVWTGQQGSAFVNCLFTKNLGRQGAGMLVDNNPDMLVTNCTFAGNVITDVTQGGGGIYSVGYTWQGGGAGPLIANCIFTDNTFANSQTQSVYQDIYYAKNGYPPYGGYIDDIRIHHSAVTVMPWNYSGAAFVPINSILYKNKLNPVGPDGKWFTADDGLQLSLCSGGIDAGDNTSIKLSTDLLNQPRIFNRTVDIGSYEFDGKPTWAKLLNTAGDSLIANKEITDSLGWTHYYKDCQYLMSIKKAGQNIGRVGDGTFELKIVTTPTYNSGKATDLTAAAYNTSGLPWYVMNRYWKVKPTNQVQDSILIRYPYTNSDYNDVIGSNPSVSKHEELEFFKVAGTDYPFDLSVPSSNFFKYTYGQLPSCSQWTYSKQDTVHLADYYVKSFSGGGGGAWLNTSLPDLILSAKSASTNSAGTGATITIDFAESNLSNISAAGSHKVQVYISTDSLLTQGVNGDALLTTYDISSLNASSASAMVSKQVLIPCKITPGNYYLLFVADAQNSVLETNEHNNIAIIQITITAGLTAPVAPIITATPAGAICSGSSATLAANSNGCSSCTYAWSNGVNGNSITASAASNYVVTSTNVCGSASATYNLVVNPTPVVTLYSSADSICAGSSIELTATGATSYSWTGIGLSSTTGAKVTAMPSGSDKLVYSVIGSSNGCTAEKSVTITVASLVTPSVTINSSNCSGGAITFTASPVNGGNNPQYQWYVNNSLQAGGNTYTINGATNGTQVYAKMTSDAACAYPQTVTSSVATVNCVLTSIPAIDALEYFKLSPNPSAGNIQVQMKLLQSKTISMKVIDAFGKTIYQTESVRIIGAYSTQINLSTAPQGIYYLETQIASENFVEKIVIVR